MYTDDHAGQCQHEDLGSGKIPLRKKTQKSQKLEFFGTSQMAQSKNNDQKLKSELYSHAAGSLYSSVFSYCSAEVR